MAKLFNGYFQQDTTKKKDSVKILVDSTAFKAKAIKTTNPQITVTGKVLDEKNVGLSGVVIKVKGKTNSFFTDLDGKFKVTKIIFKKIKWALPFLI